MFREPCLPCGLRSSLWSLCSPCTEHLLRGTVPHSFLQRPVAGAAPAGPCWLLLSSSISVIITCFFRSFLPLFRPCFQACPFASSVYTEKHHPRATVSLLGQIQVGHVWFTAPLSIPLAGEDEVGLWALATSLMASRGRRVLGSEAQVTHQQARCPSRLWWTKLFPGATESCRQTEAALSERRQGACCETTWSLASPGAHTRDVSNSSTAHCWTRAHSCNPRCTTSMCLGFHTDRYTSPKHSPTIRIICKHLSVLKSSTVKIENRATYKNLYYWVRIFSNSYITF